MKSLALRRKKTKIKSPRNYMKKLLKRKIKKKKRKIKKRMKDKHN